MHYQSMVVRDYPTDNELNSPPEYNGPKVSASGGVLFDVFARLHTCQVITRTNTVTYTLLVWEYEATFVGGNPL